MAKRLRVISFVAKGHFPRLGLLECSIGPWALGFSGHWPLGAIGLWALGFRVYCYCALGFSWALELGFRFLGPTEPGALGFKVGFRAYWVLGFRAQGPLALGVKI